MDGRPPETLVKGLQEYINESERRVSELEYDKFQMSKRIAHLESVLETKDNILREYLRRVALLEYTIRKTKPPGVPSGYMLAGDPASIPGPLPEGIRPASFRDVVRGYLAELGDLATPGQDEVIPDSIPAIAVEEKKTTSSQPSPPPTVLESSQKQWQLERTINASLFSVNSIGVVNNQLILSGSDEGLIKCWPKESKENTTASLVLRGHKGPIRSLSVKSTVCVSGGQDGKLIAWHVDPLALSKLEAYPSTADLQSVTKPSIIATAHSGGICDVQFHSEIPVIASGGTDRAVCVWRVDHDDGNFFLRDSSSEPLRMWFRDLAAPASVLSWYSADRNKLVAGMSDGSVTLFDIASEKLVTGIKAPSGSVSVTAIVSGTDRLFIAYSNGHLRMIDLKSSSNVSSGLTIVGAGDHITCMSEYGTPLITGSAKGVVATWDYRAGQQKAVSEFQAPSAVADLKVFGDNLATCGSDGKIFLYR
jgi:WD40 repeat protein